MSNAGLMKTTFLLVLGLQMAACSSSDERSLILLDLKLAGGAAAPEGVVVRATSNGAEVRTPASVPWINQASPTLAVGLFIPAGIVGPVTIRAQGLRGGVPVLEGMLGQPVPLKAGGSVGPFELVLNPTVAPPTGYDGGVDAGVVEVGAGPEPSGLDGSSPDRGASEAGPGDGIHRMDVVPDAIVADAPLPSDSADANLVQPDAPWLPDGAAPTTDTGNPVDTRPVPGWEPALNVENDLLNTSRSPVLVVEPVSENVYVAWTEDTAVKVKRWGRATGTWGTTVSVETRGEPRDVAIGADAKGNTHLVWSQYLRDEADASLAGTWASRTTDGVAWSSPVRIGSLPTATPLLAVARNGTARAVYRKEVHDPDQSFPLYTAYFDGTGWTENPTPIEKLDNNTFTQDPRLVVSETGDGIVIYNSAQATLNIAAVTLIGQSVSAPFAVNPGDLDTQYGDRTIAMNRKGEAVFVWSGGSSSNMGLFAKSYSPKTGWTSASPAITTSDSLYSIAAALDEQGNVTIVWQQGTMTGMNMLGIHGLVTGSWSGITPLETDNKASYLTSHYGFPRMAIDGNGDVLVVWRKDQGTAETATYGAYASRFSNGSWLPQVKLGQKTGLDVTTFGLSVSDKGLGAVGFAYYSGSLPTSDPDAYNAMVAFYR